MGNLAFGRIITAMVTPFKANGDVDYKKAAFLAEHLLANGTDTVLVCATTGEAPTLSSEEKLKLFDAVKERIGNKLMICGTGTNSTKATVDFSLKAKEHGADALLIVTPYYNKPPQPFIYEHFRAVAEAVELPIIAYNIPGRTGTEIKPETLVKIASLPNVVAVKESLPSIEPISALSVSLESMDMSLVKGYEKFVSDRPMEIYSGDDSAILPTLAVGGVGVVSVSSHVAGNLMQEMIQAYFAGEAVKAKKLHLRLYPLFTGMFATTNPILPKAALKLMGIDVGGLRAPLGEATAEETAKLKAVMERAGIL